MVYNIKAIPTLYSGVLFRSRLEARWAAFFDLMKWTWDYEPFDLDGYIPDFILGEKYKWIVEVKPYIVLEQTDDVVDTQRKMEMAGVGERYAILGTKPWNVPWNDVPERPLVPVLGFCNFNSGVWNDYLFRMTPYECNVCGRIYPDFSVSICDSAIMQFSKVEQCWKTAGNAVQWKPGRRLR